MYPHVYGHPGMHQPYGGGYGGYGGYGQFGAHHP